MSSSGSTGVSERESIWSVSQDDLRLYSILFPSFWLAGVIYYAIFISEWDAGWATVIGQLVIGIGAVGVSAAVLSMMVLAGRRLTMVLFDWTTKAEKRREEGRNQVLELLDEETRQKVERRLHLEDHAENQKTNHVEKSQE